MPTITLDCTEITKTYTTTDPPTQVLHGVDLQVPEGEFLVIMGASGSGKSTLLYNISGMDRPTAGTVRLEGRELTGLSDKEMSRVRLTRMGFVFQQAYFLSNLTIRDNVLLPALKADPRRAEEVVSRVDALLDRFGIGHVKQHGITEVSGGQLHDGGGHGRPVRRSRRGANHRHGHPRPGLRGPRGPSGVPEGRAARGLAFHGTLAS